ncbi:MAG: TonB-dependent receptor, partial [Bacteroidia bacterium]|nr:TonB-dependent receptor [Bacteroidia bacterium]
MIKEKKILNPSIGILIILLLFGTFHSYSQADKVLVEGKVIVKNSGQPIPYATVALLSTESNEIIAGTSTNDEGAFSLSSGSKQFYVEISFIGFIKRTIKDIQIVDGKVNLGSVSLEENSSELGEVTIEAEQSTTEFKLDKRVFNVGKDLSSTGASVLEVLNNVPSVNVNIEGEITLRGSSGVQILINGMPSVIASEQGNALG